MTDHTHDPDEFLDTYSLEEHLNAVHGYRLNNLMGMIFEEKKALHEKEHQPTGYSGTLGEFMAEMTKHYPSAQIGQDNNMQIVIYTGLYLTSDDDSNEIVVAGDPNA